MGALADPFLELAPGKGEFAVRTIEPRQPFGLFEDADIGQRAVLEALQDDALAARHLVDLVELEDQEFAVLTDGCDVIAVDRNADARLLRLGHVQDLLALARRGNDLFLRNDKAVRAGRSHEQFARSIVDEYLRNIVVFFEIDHEAHGLTVSPAARKRIGFEGEELAVRREQNELVRGERFQGALQFVALLELELRQVILVALERPDPSLLGQDDGDRLFLDEGGFKIDIDLRRVGEGGTAAADGGLLRELLARLLHFFRDAVPLHFFGL